LWKEVSHKKKYQNSPKQMSCKQPKTDNYWLNKSMSIFSFDELTKILSDINNNEKVETTVKPSLIFVARFINIQLFSQLLEKSP